MNSSQYSYHEKLLQWVWETTQFNRQYLRTVSGLKVRIHHPGSLNKTDGPDFRSAEITIGSLRWYGDVEIHRKLSDWQSHAHMRDPRYNNVILHVVFEETSKTVRRHDQSAVPTLWLGPYLSKPLESFLIQYLKHPQLPCAKYLSFISEEAFLKQLEKTHKEYFEQKVDDLLTFYDPSLPPSRAWLKMLNIAFFDGLGISHNRKPMRELGRRLFDRIETYSSADNLRNHALAVSGILADDRPSARFQWNHKGCRPNNHPEHRIQQAALGLWHLYHLPFEQWMQEEPAKLWDHLVQSIDITPSLGQERAAILFGVVFLPALYALGSLFQSGKLKNKSWNLWQTHRVPLPKSLLKTLHKTAIDPGRYSKKLGTIHQLRNYCKAGQCQKCFVFNYAISP
ncbi:Protein of unknown function [Fodinibius roseus]|uniref:DUF2851 domain-containing protein n=1 Tax=Fodinibius roseus TaxID=1194090 RepID=A0A1M5CY96_9BACT|nr:DUF2851 family protein [Fodinibius roseus]SHF59680.1 Protein of unknown function [Fodinibius roseus]